MDETRPFAGIEVVEFGQFIAVPWCVPEAEITSLLEAGVTRDTLPDR